MSDTPISDSTAHNVAELGMLCRRLERELNVANDRIQRLEEAGDDLYDGWRGNRNNMYKYLFFWTAAKEAKP